MTSGGMTCEQAWGIQLAGRMAQLRACRTFRAELVLLRRWRRQEKATMKMLKGLTDG